MGVRGKGIRGRFGPEYAAEEEVGFPDGKEERLGLAHSFFPLRNLAISARGKRIPQANLFNPSSSKGDNRQTSFEDWLLYGLIR